MSISSIDNKNLESISMVFGSSLTGISSIMGVELSATGSGGPTPPAPQWEEHWEFGADGFGGSGEWTDDFWNVYGGYWDETEDPGYMEIHVDDPYATWNLGYRPTKCRVTGTPNGTGGEVTLLDVDWVIIGSYPSVGEYDTVIEFDLTWVDEYEEPLGDLVHLYLAGYATVTKIEFLVEAAVLYTLTIGVATGSGSVLPVTGTQYYNNTGLTISGIANSGWAFTSWTGDTGNIENASAAVTSLIIPLNADTTINANFGAAWREVATTLNSMSVEQLTVHNGKVYGGAGNGSNDIGLYEWNNLDAWVEVAPGFGSYRSISDLVSYNGAVFAVADSSGESGKLLYWNGSNDWVEATEWDPSAWDNNKLVVHGGVLWMASNKLWSWDGEDTWVLEPFSTISGTFSDIISFAGNIYGVARINPGAGYYDGYLYYYDGDYWVQVVDGATFNQQLYTLAVYNSKLYAAGANGKLYEYNNSNAWVEKAAALGTGNIIVDLCVFNNKLYAGVGTGNQEGSLWRWNDTDAWVRELYPFGSEEAIRDLVTDGAEIYGSIDGGDNEGGLYAWDGSVATTRLVPIADIYVTPGDYPWIPRTGSDLYAVIDEGVDNDTLDDDDAIEDGTSGPCILQLTDSEKDSGDYQFRVRARSWDRQLESAIDVTFEVMTPENVVIHTQTCSGVLTQDIIEGGWSDPVSLTTSGCAALRLKIYNDNTDPGLTTCLVTSVEVLMK